MNDQKKCRVTIKNKEYNGIIVEEIFDKVKVKVYDKNTLIKTDWFENSKIKRIW